MSVTQFTPDARLEDHPPGGFLQRIAAILTALLLLTGSIVLGITPSAHAATAGVGYWSANSFLGAFNPGTDGRQAYCADLDAAPPWSATSGPQTITSFDSVSRQQLAELNYVMAKYGQSSDPNMTAAVQLFVWSITSAASYNSHGMSGDDYNVTVAPAPERPTILGYLAAMRQEAAVYAVTESP